MKRFLLSIMAVVSLFTVKANGTWPITLTTADGLPGKKVSMYKTFASRLFTFDEPTSKLRITVCETTSTATGNNSGRISNGPGFPYITLSELRVLNAKGEPISYTITTNAQASNSGLVEDLTDGDTLTYFQSTTGKGTYNGHYHHMELTFEKPISSFSVEWDSHYYMHTTMPEYVGLTPGTDYAPYPEQKMMLDKVTNIDELKNESGLFLLEGHSPQWHYESYNQTYAGGGYFESPYLATAIPSASGLFNLIPVDGKKDTYYISYFNHARYLSAGKGYNQMNWTDDESKAAEVKFKKLSDNNFELTANDDKLIIVEDAYMKLYTLENSEDGKKVSKRPFSSIFTIHKADISGTAVVDRIQETIDEAERRIALYHKYMSAEQTLENNLKKHIEDAKKLLNSTTLTYTEFAEFATNFNNLLKEYVGTYAYQNVDSMLYISEQLSDKTLPTSTDSKWKIGTFPEDYITYLELTAIELSEAVINSRYLEEIDENIEKLQKHISDFWNSRVSCITDIPFQVGMPNDGLPGTLQSNGAYKWTSPLYYLNEPVEKLRFTVVKTNNGESYMGYDVPALAEFELYDEFGRKVNLTEEMITVNSLTTFGGSTIAKMLDGQANTYYCGAFSPEKADVYGYAENPQYCYIDVVLPQPMSAFRYTQLGYSVGTRVPVEFIFSEYGVKAEPQNVNFVDANKTICGEQVTDLSQITDDGIYAICGLYNCDPVHGKNGNKGFYSSDIKAGKNVHSQCAFYITSAGNGKYNIRSLGNGKYWPHAEKAGELSAVDYRSQAAQVKIVARGNSGLPNSFVIYEEGTSDAPYTVFQDWGDKLGCFQFASLDNCEKDGQNEWYIYRVNMERPAHYLLGNLIDNANAMDLPAGTDPGQYTETFKFMEQLKASQAAFDAHDYAACPTMVEKMTAEIDATLSLNINPVVEGIYVIESAYEAFERISGNKMAIRSIANSSSEGEGNYRFIWAASPMSDAVIDSTFCFELISAASDGEAANTYYLRNVATGEYMGANEALYTPIVSTTDRETAYTINFRGKASFEIINSTDKNKALFINNHKDGTATKGDVVYGSYQDKYSRWNLRLLSGKTSISTPVIEGDEIVSVHYYTPAGIATSTPVKGMNIVKYVYANGAVKSEKIFIK